MTTSRKKPVRACSECVHFMVQSHTLNDVASECQNGAKFLICAQHLEGLGAKHVSDAEYKVSCMIDFHV